MPIVCFGCSCSAKMTGAPDLCGYYRAISETPVNIKHDAAKLHCHAAEKTLSASFCFASFSKAVKTIYKQMREVQQIRQHHGGYLLFYIQPYEIIGKDSTVKRVQRLWHCVNFLQCALLFFLHNSTKLTKLIWNGNLETNLNWRAEDTTLITV